MAVSLLDKLKSVPLAFVDVETTGASAEWGDRVIEIGIARVEGGQRVAEYQQLVDPGRRISAGACAITGITQDMVNGQPTFNDILPRVVPPGPDNPLGLHAMRLGLPGYLIHGTNKPSGVGMRVTHGCVRMFPEDIEALYKTVPVGTSVNIVNQPVKIGWTADGTLYLEAHPALAESTIDGESVVDASAPLPEQIQESPLTSLMRAYIAATDERRVELDWDAAERVAQFGNGVPQAVSVAGSARAIETEIAAVLPDPSH